eukprot:364784-Chlamydomonas_euryale.AAC.18
MVTGWLLAVAEWLLAGYWLVTDWLLPLGLRPACGLAKEECFEARDHDVHPRGEEQHDSLRVKTPRHTQPRVSSERRRVARWGKMGWEGVARQATAAWVKSSGRQRGADTLLQATHTQPLGTQPRAAPPHVLPRTRGRSEPIPVLRPHMCCPHTSPHRACPAAPPIALTPHFLTPPHPIRPSPGGQMLPAPTSRPGLTGSGCRMPKSTLFRVSLGSLNPQCSSSTTPRNPRWYLQK